MKRAWILAVAMLALAACETTPSGPPPLAGGAQIPSSPIDLGTWRSATAPSTLAAFEQTVALRYGAGLPLAAVNADLRRNDFNCAPPREGDGRGDPAAQVCRRTTTVSGCTHTWQVHLFDENNNAVLARARGLYDRRCGGDGLLGGPS